MIDLGTSKLKDASSVLFTREKLWNLLTTLGLPELSRSRIVTSFSNVSRALLNLNQECHFQIELDDNETSGNLFLHLYCKEYLPAGEDLPLFTPKEVHEKKSVTASYSLANGLVRAARENAKSLRAGFEKKSTEELYELVKGSKLNTIGLFAAGTAHELNNPLMGVMNYIQYALENLDPKNELADILSDAEKEVKRCVDIVQNILSFSRVGEIGSEKKSEVNCAEVMKRVLQLINFRTRGEGINVVTHFDDNIPKLLLQANDMQHVFLNLVVNALNAMEDRVEKCLTVEVRCISGKVITSIKDTGKGIAPENFQKVFEPFFTTMKAEKGTGLGLAICKKIVEEHDGALHFNSEVDVGTTMIVTLPVVLR